MKTLIGALLKEGLSYATLAFLVIPFIASLNGAPASASPIPHFSLPAMNMSSIQSEIKSGISSAVYSTGLKSGSSSVYLSNSRPIFLN